MSNENGVLRRAILESDDLEIRKIETPEWGVDCVWVRTLTGAERDAFEESSLIQQGKSYKTNLKNLRARLIVRVCVDEAGHRVFADGDADAVGRKNAKTLDRIFDVAQEMNGLRAEDVEELAGKSDGAPS